MSDGRKQCFESFSFSGGNERGGNRHWSDVAGFWEGRLEIHMSRGEKMWKYWKQEKQLDTAVNQTSHFRVYNRQSTFWKINLFSLWNRLYLLCFWKITFHKRVVFDVQCWKIFECILTVPSVCSGVCSVRRSYRWLVLCISIATHLGLPAASYRPPYVYLHAWFYYCVNRYHTRQPSVLSIYRPVSLPSS